MKKFHNPNLWKCRTTTAQNHPVHLLHNITEAQVTSSAAPAIQDQVFMRSLYRLLGMGIAMIRVVEEEEEV